MAVVPNKDISSIIGALKADDLDEFIALTSRYKKPNLILPEGLGEKPLKWGAFLIDAAAYYGAEECFSFLMGAESKLSNVDNHNKNVAHFAAYSGNTNIFDMIESAGFSLQKITRGQNTVAHIAAKYGHLEIIQMLYMRGIPIDTENKKKLKPVHLALMNEHFEIYDFFKQVTDTSNILVNDKGLLLHAIKYGKHQLLSFLLNLNVKQEPDSKGMYPIHYAVRKRDIDLFNKLVENGADVESRDGCNNTPLILAASMCSLEFVDMILDYDVNIDAQNRDGRTALHQAAYRGSVDIVELLLDEGANYELIDGNGFTAMNIATLRNKKDCILIFEELGMENYELEPEDPFRKHNYCTKYTDNPD